MPLRFYLKPRQSLISTTESQNSLIVRWPLNLEYFILMWVKGIQLNFQIFQIPQGNSLISWFCGKNELTIRIKRKAVHFTSVSINKVSWFGNTVWSRLIKFDQVSLIISFWSSATNQNRDSWNRCQETSSTVVCPVKMVFISTIFPSFGRAMMSHRQMVWSYEALSVHWDLASKRSHSVPLMSMETCVAVSRMIWLRIYICKCQLQL